MVTTSPGRTGRLEASMRAPLMRTRPESTAPQRPSACAPRARATAICRCAADPRKRLLAFLVALELLFQGQQLGERRIRIGLFAAARLFARTPDPVGPLSRPAIAVTVAVPPRPASGAFLAIADDRARSGRVLPLRALLARSVPLLGAGLGFDGRAFDGLAFAILALAAIAAAVTRTAVTFLALAIGRRRGITGNGLSVGSRNRGVSPAGWPSALRPTVRDGGGGRAARRRAGGARPADGRAATPRSSRARRAFAARRTLPAAAAASPAPGAPPRLQRAFRRSLGGDVGTRSRLGDRRRHASGQRPARRRRRLRRSVPRRSASACSAVSVAVVSGGSAGSRSRRRSGSSAGAPAQSRRRRLRPLSPPAGRSPAACRPASGSGGFGRFSMR